MSRYFIEAADVLFFKDGREIAPGSEYSAASVFPPHPGTLYGAIRSALLAQDENTDFSKSDFGNLNKQVQELVGSWTEKGELYISDYSLAYNNNGQPEPLFRLPCDVLKRKKPDKDKGEREEVHMSKPFTVSSAGIRSNQPLSNGNATWFYHQEGAVFEHDTAFITEEQFYAYLTCDLGSRDQSSSLSCELLNEAKEKEQEFKKEPRMGIVISRKTHTVEEGKLFTTPFIRPRKDIGLLVELNVDLDVLPDQTKLRLGGDGKMALLNETQHHGGKQLDESLGEKVVKSSRIKMVLTTPAVFEKGWIPDGLDESGRGQINGVEVQLEGASLGKHEIIGGWDVANKHPKKSRRAVPAGSVYYLTTDAPGQAFAQIHRKSICGNDDDRKQGLGITYIGVTT